MSYNLMIIKTLFFCVFVLFLFYISPIFLLYSTITRRNYVHYDKSCILKSYHYNRSYLSDLSWVIHIHCEGRMVLNEEREGFDYGYSEIVNR
jgi:cbb3-type cytochrome oxidase subunit 3